LEHPVYSRYVKSSDYQLLPVLHRNFCGLT